MSLWKTPISAISDVYFVLAIHGSSSLTRWQHAIFEPILLWVIRSTATRLAMHVCTHACANFRSCIAFWYVILATVSYIFSENAHIGNYLLLANWWLTVLLLSRGHCCVLIWSLLMVLFVCIYDIWGIGVFSVVSHKALVIHTVPWMDLMSMVSCLWNNQQVQHV